MSNSTPVTAGFESVGGGDSLRFDVCVRPSSMAHGFYSLHFHQSLFRQLTDRFPMQVLSLGNVQFDGSVFLKTHKMKSVSLVVSFLALSARGPI